MGQMPESDDHRLLAEFVRGRSETAFTELVTRYAGLVYSTAYRFCGNTHSAEEITQAVFVILARKAGTLSPRVAVSGWLYQTARLTAANFVKGEIRRRRREQEAAMQSNLLETGPTDWTKIAPLLDDAMGALGEADRNAVLLRYFENRTSSEIGVALRMNEETARKRVNRALEKLRHFFVKRGVTISSATLSGAISANSVQPVSTLVMKTISAVAVAKGSTASMSTLALVKGALKIMAWTKTKTAVVIGAGVLLTAGTTMVVVQRVLSPPTVAANDKVWDQYYQILTNNTSNEPTERLVDQLMRNHPPMAVIRLTPEERRRRAQFRIPGVRGQISGLGNEHGHIAIGTPLQMVLRYVYDLDPTNYPQTRIIIPPDLESTSQPLKYDYIDTVPHGGREKLQQALKDQFGLVVRRETRSNLVLRVKTSGASGLHPHGTAGNGFNASNVTMPALAKDLRRIFGVNVTDETGLTNGYDFTLDLPRPPTPDDLKHALEEQIGLGLTPATNDQGVEFIVVEKAK